LLASNTTAWSHRKNAGHSNPQKYVVWKAVCNTRQRTIKNEILDDVSTDLSKMGINEWRGRARDREVWRRIGMEAKAHPGL
jgi:hypothetical protein